MAVKYVRLPRSISRDRERVSKEWRRALLDAHKAGVKFNVNEGHRTMARQAGLVREMGSYPYGKAGYGTGAAAPSSTAPHIRVGRIDHAIDCDGAVALVTWLRKQGIYAIRPMSKEPWHIEAPASYLSRYYTKRTKRIRVLRALRKKKLQAKRKLRALRKKKK